MKNNDGSAHSHLCLMFNVHKPCPQYSKQHTLNGNIITKYGSTSYIGMDEVLAHYA